MGSWDRRRLQTMYDHGLLCAFTRQWNKKKDRKRYSPLLRARDWYRDCHVLPVEQDGDHIICEVVIMGRITYDGEILLTVPPRMRSGHRHKIRLPANMRVNSYDPSD